MTKREKEIIELLEYLKSVNDRHIAEMDKASEDMYSQGYAYGYSDALLMAITNLRN